MPPPPIFEPYEEHFFISYILPVYFSYKERSARKEVTTFTAFWEWSWNTFKQKFPKHDVPIVT